LRILRIEVQKPMQGNGQDVEAVVLLHQALA